MERKRRRGGFTLPLTCTHTHTHERETHTHLLHSSLLQGTGATSIFLQAATWIDDPELVEDFRRWCIVWPYSIKQVRGVGREEGGGGGQMGEVRGGFSHLASITFCRLSTLQSSLSPPLFADCPEQSLPGPRGCQPARPL